MSNFGESAKKETEEERERSLLLLSWCLFVSELRIRRFPSLFSSEIPAGIFFSFLLLRKDFPSGADCAEKKKKEEELTLYYCARQIEAGGRERRSNGGEGKFAM